MSATTLPAPAVTPIPASPPAPPPPVTTPVAPPPPFKAYVAFRKFRVDEYQKMIDAGILTDADDVELLSGYVVFKTPRNAPHDSTIAKLYRRVDRLAPAGYVVRAQSGTQFEDSRPEPDLVIARGDETAFDHRQPAPADLALVAEVSDSSLDRDRHDNGRIYAADAVPVYWIVNLVDRHVEVYTNPTGPVPDSQYQRQQIYYSGSQVPLELGGNVVGTVPVDELLP